MSTLSSRLGPRKRIVAGIMSGTSLDGVDAAIVRLSGSGRDVQIETLGFASEPYDADLRERLAAQVEASTSDVRGLAVLHAALAERFAEVTRAALDTAGLTPADLDLVGSHGQTVQHVPEAETVGGYAIRATLQIGDPTRLAARLGAPVVADVRSADVALGGQGAPLAPYLDDCLFAHPTETRGLLNLGGIANLTVLPAGGGPETTRAFDTGPANMVADALMLRLTGEPFDRDGALASRGTPDLALVRRLLQHETFREPPPKSTGREAFGRDFVDRFLADGPEAPEDLVATALALTAHSITEAVDRFVPEPLDRMIASGGGVRNPVLLGMLRDLLPCTVETTASYGLDPDAKEAVLFALLAHEWANGVRTGLPSVTGASRPAMQGALYLP
ncbi:MAG: anhydro-N-acetylmuramic acid kinase [Bacteroidota bacterium]